MTSDLNPTICSSSIVVLTGAGASVPFGMPAMANFCSCCDSEKAGILQQICRPFLPDNSVDLEFVLGKLEFYENEITRDLLNDGFLTRYFGSSTQHIATEMGKFCRNLRGYLYEKIIETYGLLSEEQQTIARNLYLDLFMELAARNRTVLPVFTTNYDLMFESLTDSNSQFRMINGMRPTAQGYRWDPTTYSESLADLAVFRLHGCSHWFQRKRDKAIWFQALPDLKDPSNKGPQIIYPEPGKDARLVDEPFVTAYRYFRHCLKSADLIIIIGYSGRDEVIQEALRESMADEKPWHDASVKKRFIVITRSEELPPHIDRILPKKRVIHLRAGIEHNAGRLSAFVTGEIPEYAVAGLKELETIHDLHNASSQLLSGSLCQCDPCKEYRARRIKTSERQLSARGVQVRDSR